MTSATSALAITAAFDPFAQTRVSFRISHGLSLRDIVRRAIAEVARRLSRAASDYDWFFDVGVVRVGRRRFKPSEWATVKPRAGQTVDLCMETPGKGGVGRVLLVLAAVALAVTTAWIASGGIAVALGLGASSTFAAGGVGALLASPFLGIAGQLALNALTPAPSLPREEGTRELSMAGIQGNPLSRGDVIARVIGRMRVSPQIVWPSYTTIRKEKTTVHAMVAVDGDCAVSGILVNKVPIETIPGAVWEVKAGDGAAGDTYLSRDFTIQERLSLVLSNYNLKDDSNARGTLVDQVTPQNSYSKYHRLPDKKAEAPRYSMRLLFPGGLAGPSGEDGAIGLRPRIRKLGDVAWRELPTIHIRDVRGVGPFQQDITLHWSEPIGGQWVARNDALNCYALHCKTGEGYAYEWNSDPYFKTLAGSHGSAVPLMSGPTSGPVTVSASSEYPGYPAWQGANGFGSFWQSDSPILPQWWQVDWGAGNTKTLRSYGFVVGSNTTFGPKRWRLEGKNPGDPDWTVLHDQSVLPTSQTQSQVSVIAPFQTHRLLLLENYGAANNSFILDYVYFTETDLKVASIVTSTGVKQFSGVGYLARYCDITEDGVDFYLKPSDWPQGQYEIEVRRSWAYYADSLMLDITTNGSTNYYYGGPDAAFFSHYLNGTTFDIATHQKDMQSETTIASVANYFPFRAIREDFEHGLTRIAVSVPSLDIQSISAIFEGKARVLTGQEWSDQPQITRNPAAYFRDAKLLSRQNAEPLPGEVLDENSVEGFFTHCVTHGITCDALVQGRDQAEIAVLLTSVAKATPRNGNAFAVTIDHDRSAEVPVAMLTPESSRDEGSEKIFETVPHALRVSYLDEADDYKLKDVTVYRAGFSAATATLIEAMPPFDGVVTEARAIDLARYHFGQMLYRNVTYTRVVGLEGLTYGKGDYVEVADDVLLRQTHFGLVKSILTAGATITGFTLYGAALLSGDYGQFGVGSFGIKVRRIDGTVFSAAISNIADTDTLMLVTPIPDTGLFDVDQLIAVGPLGRESVPCVVQSVEHLGGEEFRVKLLPVGNQIFQ